MRYRFLLLFVTLLVAGCGDVTGTRLCGGGEQPLETPPAPVFGSFPTTTNLTTLPISGERYPDTAITIDGVEVIPVGCDRFWTTSLDLPAEGDHTFTFRAISSTANRSASVELTLTRDSINPAAPTVADPADTANGSVDMTGAKEAGSGVRLNGKLLVPADATTGFAANVPLGNGANALSFTLFDAAGNVSAATVVNVTRLSTPTLTSRPIFPLNRQRLAGPDVQMVWTRPADVNINDYLLQVSTDPSFDGIPEFDATPALLVPWATYTGIPAGTHYWRVATRKVGGETSFGPTWSFVIGTVPTDVDGDGLSEMIAGVPGDDGGQETVTQDNRGRIDLVFGGVDVGDAAKEPVGLSITGPEPGAEFGISAAMGDVNGDGFADILVGAHRVNATERDTGAAYLYFGSVTPDSTADLIFKGQNTGDGFGVVVRSGFDLNADGYDDMAIGAWLYDTDGDTDELTDAGRLYVFFGGDTLDTVPDLILTGEEALENFGSAIDGGFDINGDGYDDLAVGGPLADKPGLPPTVDAGRAVIYYGGPAVDAVADLIVYGERADAHFGASVSGAGDMDGDGFDEFAAGSPAWDIAIPSQGQVGIFAGGLMPAVTVSLTLSGATANEAFGTALSGGADLDTDGYADLAVGVPFSDQGGADKSGTGTEGDLGMVEIHRGAATLNAVWDARIFGENFNDWMGIGLHMTGDVNGDGGSDLIFGAPNNDTGSVLFGDVGRAYVLFGDWSGAAWWGDDFPVTDIGIGRPVPGAILANDHGKDGLGASVW